MTRHIDPDRALTLFQMGVDEYVSLSTTEGSCRQSLDDCSRHDQKPEHEVAPVTAGSGPERLRCVGSEQSLTRPWWRRPESLDRDQAVSLEVWCDNCMCHGEAGARFAGRAAGKSRRDAAGTVQAQRRGPALDLLKPAQIRA